MVKHTQTSSAKVEPKKQSKRLKKQSKRDFVVFFNLQAKKTFYHKKSCNNM